MFKNTLLVSLVGITLSGCVGLNTVSMTQVPAERENIISTNSSSWNLIGINFSNAFVDEAIGNLKAQCPTGKIEGVYTKHQTTGYVLVFKREVIVSAYCNEV
ncbi:hypothetical protein [Colwellia psychrerythraea]|uniref:Lipoprotein n=1 Tax=Colwellia psychrerythraea TaxID=28229 RepID=A0A099KWD9_COLPS|nr:hypothetical protein [Colwellia psychrerythraea]KGJ93968.1 hypothetical protein GAB14E_2523 [Colwellia psychrerythraea]